MKSFSDDMRLRGVMQPSDCRGGVWRTFAALLARDGHVASRNLAFTLTQNLLQPLLPAFVFGRISRSAV